MLTLTSLHITENLMIECVEAKAVIFKKKL